MRISPEQIKKLQELLKEQTGRDYSDDEAQVAGLAIMHFVISKEQREITNKENPRSTLRNQPDIKLEQSSTMDSEIEADYNDVSNNLVDLIELLAELDEKQRNNPNPEDNQGIYLLDEKGRKIIL